MDSRHRLSYGVRNYAVGLLTSLLSGVALFLGRIVFLRYMSVEYVGYTTLFENVFLLLSALDLGVATSLTSFMALSMKNGEGEREKRALDFSRRIYLSVSGVMMSVGLIFALLYFRGERAFLLLPCLFYLLGQCSQYYLGWRVLALNAEGRNDIVSVFVQIGRLVQYSLEVLVIVTTRNFLLYILVSLICTTLSYLSLHVVAPRVCPWIKEKGEKKDERAERRVLRTLPAMASHRVGTIFFRAFEGIAVTFLFGAAAGGRYGNLLLVSSFVMTLFWIFQSSVTGIVGDHVAKEDRESVWRLYRKVSVINLSFSFLCGLLFSLFALPLSAIFFGKENVPGKSVSSAMAMVVFLSSSRIGITVLRDGLGEYRRDWYKPIVEVIMTILLVSLLSPRFGEASIPLSISTVLLLVSLPLDHSVVAFRIKRGRKAVFSAILMSLISILGATLIYFAGGLAG